MDKFQTVIFDINYDWAVASAGTVEPKGAPAKSILFETADDFAAVKPRLSENAVTHIYVTSRMTIRGW